MAHVDTYSINPFLRTAQHCTIPVGSTLRRRIISDFELLYVESGTLRINYNDKDYVCPPESFLLFHPATPHLFYSSNEEVSQPHIHFDLMYNAASRFIPISFKDAPEFTNEEKALICDDFFTNHTTAPFITFRDHKSAKRIFFETIDAFQGRQVFKAKASMLLLVDMLICDNFPHLLSNDTISYDVITQIKDFIDSGQAMEMTLDDFEKRFAYSRYYLEKQFKKKYDISLIGYRNIIKMKVACQMLEGSSVSDTATKLGFSSVYAFSRAFKNYMKISPLEYKQLKKQ